MDGQRFDALTRRLGDGTTRRRALKLAAGGALATFAGLGGGSVDAKGKQSCRGRGENCSSKRQCCGGRGDDVACRIGRNSGGAQTVCCGGRGASCRANQTDSCCDPLSCVTFEPGGNRGRCAEV